MLRRLILNRNYYQFTTFQAINGKKTHIGGGCAQQITDQIKKTTGQDVKDNKTYIDFHFQIKNLKDVNDEEKMIIYDYLLYRAMCRSQITSTLAETFLDHLKIRIETQSDFDKHTFNMIQYCQQHGLVQPQQIQELFDKNQQHITLNALRIIKEYAANILIVQQTCITIQSYGVMGNPFLQNVRNILADCNYETVNPGNSQDVLRDIHRFNNICKILEDKSKSFLQFQENFIIRYSTIVQKLPPSPTFTIILLSSIFHSKLDHQKVSKPVAQIIMKTIDQQHFSNINFILSYLVKFGYTRDEIDVKKLEQVLIKQYKQDSERATLQSKILSIRSAIFYNFQEYLALVGPFLNEWEPGIFKKTVYVQALSDQQTLFAFYQANFMLPYYIKFKNRINMTQFLEQQFKLHQTTQQEEHDAQNVFDHLDKLGVNYIKEAIIGCYTIDIFIPNMITSQEAKQRLINKESPGGQIKFQNFKEMNDFVTASLNPNSICLEIDGPTHFSGGRGRTQMGRSILKKAFFQEKLKIKMRQLTSKELYFWSNIQIPELKTLQLIDLINNDK